MNGSASTALNGYSKVPLWAHDSRMPTLGWVGVPPHPLTAQCCFHHTLHMCSTIRTIGFMPAKHRLHSRTQAQDSCRRLQHRTYLLS